MRRHLTYANIVASLAIFIALGGTATAAVVITGRNVKDSTLTGADVKNYSLGTADLSSIARRAMKGATGPKGDRGPTGLTGGQGPQGPQGDPGKDGEAAAVVTSFASRDAGFVTSNILNTPNNGVGGPFNWYDYNCAGAGNNVGECAADDGNQPNAGSLVLPLTGTGDMVVALQGMTKLANETQHSFTSNNNINVPWTTNLSAMASITLFRSQPVGGTNPIHGRAECALQYANSANPNTFADLGEPQSVSAFGVRELVSLTIVGSKDLTAGTYNVRVKCRDEDRTTDSAYDWYFVAGNLTAMAARR